MNFSQSQQAKAGGFFCGDLIRACSHRLIFYLAILGDHDLEGRLARGLSVLGRQTARAYDTDFYYASLSEDTLCFSVADSFGNH